VLLLSDTCSTRVGKVSERRSKYDIFKVQSVCDALLLLYEFLFYALVYVFRFVWANEYKKSASFRRGSPCIRTNPCFF
jgi:hypothetical protein